MIKILKRYFYILFFIFVIFSIIQLAQIYNDFYNYKYNKEKICRYNNIINSTGYICYGNVEINKNSKYFWTGNHVWNIKKDGTIKDETCLDCKIKEVIGCLEINNGYIKPSFNNIENSIISYYFIEFGILKKLNIIN